MDDKSNKRTPPKLIEAKKPPQEWQLTEEDKAFLRSCNIRPE